MLPNFVSEIDYASDCIMSLRNAKRRLLQKNDTIDLGIVQQYLDEKCFYIKQIPKVCQNIIDTLFRIDITFLELFPILYILLNHSTTKY